MASANRVILTTCPRDCYDSCGIAVVVRDGLIAQVRGDPNHPVSRGKLCAKCSAGYNNEWLDPRARLTRPLRRVGSKGTAQFAPVFPGRKPDFVPAEKKPENAPENLEITSGNKTLQVPLVINVAEKLKPE